MNRGIIVSSSGFWKTALKKAKAHGIGCHDLKMAVKLDWLAVTHLQSYKRRPTAVTVSLVCPGAGKVGMPVRLLSAEGQAVSLEDLSQSLRETALEGLRTQRWDPALGLRQSARVDVDLRDLFAQSEAGDRVGPIQMAICEIDFEVVASPIDLETVRYSSGDDKGQIAEAAVAEVSVGDVEGSLMMLRKSSAATEVVLLKNRRQRKSNAS